MKIKNRYNINLPSNEYFPKSISTKPKNDQGKSYSDRTDRQRNRETEKQTEKQTLRIIIQIIQGGPKKTRTRNFLQNFENIGPIKLKINTVISR